MSADPRTTWQGTYPAMLTPLTEEERLDPEGAVRLARGLLSEGHKGLYLTGNTGECYAIDDSVRIELFRHMASEIKEEATLIAHIGGVPTRRAVRMTHAACESGLHAVAAMTPYGGRYTDDEIVLFYRDLAAESSLPLFGYHIPSATGYSLGLDTLSQIMEIPNVIGMKFTHYDCHLLERLCTAFPDKVFLMGSDQMLLQGLSAGACGGVGTTYNLLGPWVLRVCERFANDDLNGARDAQRVVNAFVQSVVPLGPKWFRAFKALAAEKYGFRPHCASPARLDESVLEKVRTALAEAEKPTNA